MKLRHAGRPAPMAPGGGIDAAFLYLNPSAGLHRGWHEGGYSRERLVRQIDGLLGPG